MFRPFRKNKEKLDDFYYILSTLLVIVYYSYNISRVFTFWGFKNRISIFCAHLIELVELIPNIQGAKCFNVSNPVLVDISPSEGI